MESSPLTLLELLKQAEAMIQAEYDYLGSLLSNPFLSPSERIGIGSTRARLAMDMANVREKAEEVRARIIGGSFETIDENLLAQVMKATEELGKKLRAAAKLQAVLAAVAGFAGVVNAVMSPAAAAPAPAPAPALAG